MARIKLDWEEYKAFASKAIKDAYPEVDTDKPEFLVNRSYEGETLPVEMPSVVYFPLQDKTK